LTTLPSIGKGISQPLKILTINKYGSSITIKISMKDHEACTVHITKLAFCCGSYYFLLNWDTHEQLAYATQQPTILHIKQQA
jgi:hypothetical protein